jgi:hypothetical protein
MRKAEAIAELEKLVVDRLFVGPWFRDSATNLVTHKRFVELGLIEDVTEGGSHDTPLGTEVGIELFMVFVGQMAEGDIPIILEQHRLI